MNSKTLTLIVAGLLVVIGLTKPDLSSLVNRKPTPVVVNPVVFEKPTDSAILAKCDDVITSLKAGNNDRYEDGKRLASLYSDMATLLELDGENMIVRNTSEIRQANSLSGAMLKLDMKGKYNGLGKACEAVVLTAIGTDDSVNLDEALRAKAVSGFKALAWACNEGSK